MKSKSELEKICISNIVFLRESFKEKDLLSIVDKQNFNSVKNNIETYFHNFCNQKKRRYMFKKVSEYMSFEDLIMYINEEFLDYINDEHSGFLEKDWQGFYQLKEL